MSTLFSSTGWLFLLRWFHFFFGIVWIGHLYYFNFTQGVFFAKTDASTKSAAIRQLVPEALWWFRWGAMITFITGWLYIGSRVHLEGHELFASSWGIFIITGAVLGSFMWANVWFIIWPAQKIVIASANAVAAGGQADPAAAGAGARALLASRHNTLFSIPLLFFMGAASHLPLNITGSLGTVHGAVFAIIALLELNAIKGKLGPITKVSGVIHMGFLLTIVLYAVIAFLA